MATHAQHRHDARACSRWPRSLTGVIRFRRPLLTRHRSPHETMHHRLSPLDRIAPLVPTPLCCSSLRCSVPPPSAPLQIEPREEQCFFEDLVKDKNFRLEFEVVRGGLLDCKLKITDPLGQVVIDKIAYFNKEVSGGARPRDGERRQAAAAAAAAGHLCLSHAVVSLVAFPPLRVCVGRTTL